jgi:hypothetical protein
VVGPGRRWGRPAGLGFFLFSENTFTESQVGLSAHVRREGPRMLSVESSSPVERRRETVAESFLSMKASPRGKTCSARVTSLSAKWPNPVVPLAHLTQSRHPNSWRWQMLTEFSSDIPCG